MGQANVYAPGFLRFSTQNEEFDEVIMKIEISAKEYRDLLDILHLAEAVMSAHRKEEDRRTEGHRVLIQKLYSLAAEKGLERLISYSQSLNRYLPTADFEENTLAHVLLREFGDHLFWDQLIARLTLRDVAQVAGGIERINAISESDRQHMEDDIRQRYVQEFATNGVANVEVIERFSSAGMPAKTSD
jgi:hypothetical protein